MSIAVLTVSKRPGSQLGSYTGTEGIMLRANFQASTDVVDPVIRVPSGVSAKD
jgi:hypothetical protein